MIAVTRFAYDGAGRLTAVTNAFGISGQQIVTSYGYDEAGNEVTQIDALSRTTSVAYDGLGRRISRTLPQLQTETMGYDAVGNLVRTTNFNNVVITNQYDALNRLTNRSSVGGYQVAFGYDAAGNRTNMSDPSGVTGYSYDNRNRLQVKSEALSGSFTRNLNYAYDANGNVTNIYSSPSAGVNLRYGYDALNRITNVLANGGLAANYVFDGNGNLRSVAYGNGVTNLYQYDVLNRLTNSIWKSNQLALATFYYQLGATGNRTNLTETLFTSVTNRTYSWTYDSLYRLAGESISGVNETYGLDKVGNRTNRTAGFLPAQSFAYSSNDWVTTDRYDTNGNTLWTTNAGVGKGPYNYDVENQLTNFSSATFAYNGDGIRVFKWVGTTTNFYLVDDRNPTGYAQVLEEWTGTGGAPTLTRYYNYGLGLISQQDTALYYFVPDGHGSVRLLLTTVGTVANVLAYDAYGILISSNSSPQTVYLYCGEQFDSNLGFYYLRARYYSHLTGRFRTVDTIEQDMERPLTMSKYLYCSDNSLNRTDPSGLKDYELKLIYAPDRDNDYGFFDPLTYGGAFLMVSLTDNQIIVSNIKFTDNIADRTRAVVGPMHLLPGRDRITVIVIAGHGSPGDIGCPVQSLTADLSWGGLGPLTSTNTPQKRFAAYLKPYTQGHCTVYLDACNQADNQAGRDFMQILAISLGATVIGYEGTFFVTGFGDRWTATPTGVSKSEPVSSYQRFGEAMSENWIPF